MAEIEAERTSSWPSRERRISASDKGFAKAGREVRAIVAKDKSSGCCVQPVSTVQQFQSGDSASFCQHHHQHTETILPAQCGIDFALAVHICPLPSTNSFSINLVLFTAASACFCNTFAASSPCWLDGRKLSCQDFFAGFLEKS